MPLNDIIGFAAILGAGFTAGYSTANVSWGWFQIVGILALLAIGFYFAVVLS